MHIATSHPTALDAHEGRRHERTHLFLAASLCSKAGSCPVHLRNISTSGALIEGSIVPEQGDRLVLRRGSLEAAADIVWKAGRKAGIAFSSAIVTGDWTARRPSSHQGRVDDMIQAIRSGPGDRESEASEPRDVAPGCSVEAELLALKELLAELEKELIGDVIVVATHPEIQLLDVARQAIDRMLRTVP